MTKEIESYKDFMSIFKDVKIKDNKDILELSLKESLYNKKHKVFKNEIIQYKGSIRDLASSHMKILFEKNGGYFEPTEKTEVKINLKDLINPKTGELDEKKAKKRFQPTIAKMVDIINKDVEK